MPGLFGGSNKRSEEHLRRSLTYNPTSTASHSFLAETLLDMDRKAEARAELLAVVAAPLDPDWTPEDREFKEKARRLLAGMKQAESPSAGQSLRLRRLRASAARMQHRNSIDIHDRRAMNPTPFVVYGRRAPRRVR